jgi:hypothetical protein
MKQTRFVTMLGIGCITMAVLATEIALTRIFSVTLWYHFAFLVISLALLFSGVGSYWSQRVRVERIVPNLRAGLVMLMILPRK